MTLLCGIPSEPPLAMALERLERLGAPFALWNQRECSIYEMGYELRGDKITGTLTLGSRAYRLEDFTSVYTRLMEDRFLPELEAEPEASPQRQHALHCHDVLLRWYEIMPGRVVNRTASMGSNSSKPYQAQIIRRHGFHIPETLITNQPDLVVDFHKRHGRIIYKSISGVRSIVRELGPEDHDRLERLRWCPVQFQEYVEGQDIRVHTIGGEVFASAIHSDAADYRYARQQVGESAQVEATAIDDTLAQRCLALADSLGLLFAGVDLRVTPEGRVYCFEVNPSPAYSYYESNTNQPISLALAKFLSHGVSA